MELYMWHNRLASECRSFIEDAESGELLNLYENERNLYYRRLNKMKTLFKNCRKRLGSETVDDFCEGLEIEEGVTGLFTHYGLIGGLG